MALHRPPLVLALALLAAPGLAEEQGDPTMALRIEEAQTAVRQRNYAEAAETLAELAAAGNAEANYMLATLYRDGRGVPQDEATAFDLTLAAAEAGHVEAQYSLGTLYLSGRGTEEEAAEDAAGSPLPAPRGMHGPRRRCPSWRPAPPNRSRMRKSRRRRRRPRLRTWRHRRSRPSWAGPS